MKFTASELRVCAERELLRRKRDYRAKVARNRMSAGEAQREIALQEAIVEALGELERADLLV